MSNVNLTLPLTAAVAAAIFNTLRAAVDPPHARNGRTLTRRGGKEAPRVPRRHILRGAFGLRKPRGLPKAGRFSPRGRPASLFMNEGKSLAKLADELGMSHENLRQIEHGEVSNPTPRTKKSIADYLDCQVTDIWPLEETPEAVA